MGENPNEVFKSIALQRQAAVRLNAGTVFTTQQLQFIEKIIDSVEELWLELQKKQPSASEHHRYFSFLVFAKYSLYKHCTSEEKKQKYGEELIKLFEEKCLHVVLVSLDFGNLDNVASYLEVCFELGKFDQISKFCNSFLNRKAKFNIPLDFNELLNVVGLTSALGALDTNKEKKPYSVKNEYAKIGESYELFGTKL